MWVLFLCCSNHICLWLILNAQSRVFPFKSQPLKDGRSVGTKDDDMFDAELTYQELRDDGILRHFRHLSKSFGNHAQQQQQQDLNLGLGTYCGLPPVGWVHIWVLFLMVYQFLHKLRRMLVQNSSIKYRQVLGTKSVPYLFRSIMHVGIQYDHKIVWR